MKYLIPIVLALILVPCVFADWPQEGLYSNHTAYLSNEVKVNNLMWNVSIGRGGLPTGPAVVNGIVYIYANNNSLNAIPIIYAFNGTTGKQKWNHTFPTGDLFMHWPSSPAVAYGLVYSQVGADSTDWLTTQFVALNATTGVQKWIYEPPDEIGAALTYNHIVYFEAGHYAYALNATTGALKWNKNMGGPFDNTVTWTPAADKGLVYFGSYAGTVFAYNSTTGVQKWNKSVSAPVGLQSSPVVFNNKFYFTANGRVYSLNATTGVQFWNVSVGGGQSWVPLAYGNGLVYVKTNNIYALNATTGVQKWSKSGTLYPGIVGTGFVISGNSLYVGSTHNTLPDTGKLYRLNALTGATLWSSPTILGNNNRIIAISDNRVYYVGGQFDNVLPHVLYAFNVTYPNWVQKPVNRTINYNVAFNYDINATSGTDTLTYRVNDSTYFKINSATGLLQNKTLLLPKKYWLNVSVNNSLQDTLSAIIYVNVNDTAFPTWIQTPQNKSATYRVPFYYRVNATDEGGISKYWINDTTNFKIGASTGIIQNNTLLSIKKYWLNISVNDTSNKRISAIIYVNVSNVTFGINSYNVTPDNVTVGQSVTLQVNLTQTTGFSVWARVWKTTTTLWSGFLDLISGVFTKPVITNSSFIGDNNVTFNITHTASGMVEQKQVGLQVNNFTSGWCYQETANVSTLCGGLNTGKYSLTENWTNPEKIIDGNWSSFGNCTGGSRICYAYMNYTKPVGATNSSKWQISDTINVVNTTYNDVWNRCWNKYSDKLQLRINSRGIAYSGNVNWECYTSLGTWEIFYITGTSNVSAYIAGEEGMWWWITNVVNLLPFYTQYNVTPSSPQNYAIRDYIFTIDFYNVNNVFVENNFTGVMQNNSMSKVGDRYSYQPGTLPVGTYHYKFIGINSYGQNETNSFTYVVNKGDPGLYFVYVPDNVVSFVQQINVTCYSAGPVSKSMFRDNNPMTNPMITTLPIGTYNMTCTSPATASYNASRIDEKLFVVNYPPNVTLLTPFDNWTYPSTTTKVNMTFSVQDPDNSLFFTTIHWDGYNFTLNHTNGTVRSEQPVSNCRNYTWWVITTYDFYSFVNTSARKFEVLCPTTTPLPTINLVYPPSGTRYANTITQVTVNYSTTASVPSVNEKVFVNGVQKCNVNQPAGSDHTCTIMGLSQNNTYYWNASVNDGVNPTQWSGTRYFIINSTCWPNWVAQYTSCTIGDNRTKYYTDYNYCHNSSTIPGDNGTIVYCDYCTPDWYCDTFSSCNKDTSEQTCYSVTDTFGCYAITHLPSDQFSGSLSDYNQPCFYRGVIYMLLGESGAGLSLFLQYITSPTGLLIMGLMLAAVVLAVGLAVVRRIKDNA